MKRIAILTILFLSATFIYAQSCPSGTVPIKGGGTCATTAAGALANLGGAPLAGPAFTGPVSLDVPTAGSLFISAVGNSLTSFDNDPYLTYPQYLSADLGVIVDANGIPGATSGQICANQGGCPTYATSNFTIPACASLPCTSGVIVGLTPGYEPANATAPQPGVYGSFLGVNGLITVGTGKITTVTVTNGGTYTVLPTFATFTGGGGQAAGKVTGTACTPTCTVTGITLLYSWQYTSAPAVGFIGGTGGGATATAVVSPNDVLIALTFTPTQIVSSTAVSLGTQFIVSTPDYSGLQIIEAGRNDITINRIGSANIAYIKASVASMYAHKPSWQVAGVTDILNQNTSDEWLGGATYTAITGINSYWSTLYGPGYVADGNGVGLRKALVNYGCAQPVTDIISASDCAHDEPPTLSRAVLIPAGGAFLHSTITDVQDAFRVDITPASDGGGIAAGYILTIDGGTANAENVKVLTSDEALYPFNNDYANVTVTRNYGGVNVSHSAGATVEETDPLHLNTDFGYSLWGSLAAGWVERTANYSVGWGTLLASRNNNPTFNSVTASTLTATNPPASIPYSTVQPGMVTQTIGASLLGCGPRVILDSPLPPAGAQYSDFTISFISTGAVSTNGCPGGAGPSPTFATVIPAGTICEGFYRDTVVAVGASCFDQSTGNFEWYRGSGTVGDEGWGHECQMTGTGEFSCVAALQGGSVNATVGSVGYELNGIPVLVSDGTNTSLYPVSPTTGNVNIATGWTGSAWGHIWTFGTDGSTNTPGGSLVPGARTVTPVTISCGTGVFSANIYPSTSGKSIDFNLVINVTSAGTCTAPLSVSLPFVIAHDSVVGCISSAGGVNTTGSMFIPGGSTGYISGYASNLNLVTTGAEIVCTAGRPEIQ
jgi:hypothetical protein